MGREREKRKKKEKLPGLVLLSLGFIHSAFSSLNSTLFSFRTIEDNIFNSHSHKH